jgi:hypothetical protein
MEITKYLEVSDNEDTVYQIIVRYSESLLRREVVLKTHCWAGMVAKAYNSSCSRGRDWKEHSSRPAQVHKTTSHPVDGVIALNLSSQLCKEAQIGR